MPNGYNHERTVPVETQYKVMQLIPDDRPWLDQVQQLLNEHAQEGWELVTAFQGSVLKVEMTA